MANVAAVAGARTADRLHQLAEGKVKHLGTRSTSEDLKPIAALVATANEAIKPADPVQANSKKGVDPVSAEEQEAAIDAELADLA